MAFCKKCGKEVSSEKFCPECGTPVGVVEQWEPPSDNAKFAKHAAVQEQENLTQSESAEQQGRKKSSINKVPIIIIGILIVLILIVGISNCTNEDTSDTTSSTTTTSSTSTSTPSTQSSAESTQSTAPVVKTFLDTLKGFGEWEPQTVEGNGDSVIDIPNAGKPCIITIWGNDAADHFAAHSVNSSGGNIDLLVNTTDPYYGTVTTYPEFSNATMLSITSSGPWAVTFSPLSSIKRAENGGTYHADDLVYIDETSITKVTFNHSGSSNFVVKAFGMNSSKLLVNEIGPYSGTVVWNEPQSFFFVNADGDWTISW